MSFNVTIFSQQCMQHTGELDTDSVRVHVHMHSPCMNIILYLFISASSLYSMKHSRAKPSARLQTIQASKCSVMVLCNLAPLCCKKKKLHCRLDSSRVTTKCTWHCAWLRITQHDCARTWSAVQFQWILIVSFNCKWRVWNLKCMQSLATESMHDLIRGAGRVVRLKFVV